MTHQNEYSTWENKYLTEIKDQFTTKELIDFIAIYRLGKQKLPSREYESTFNLCMKIYESEKEAYDFITHYFMKTNLINLSFEGLEKLGLICILNDISK